MRVLIVFRPVNAGLNTGAQSQSK